MRRIFLDLVIVAVIVVTVIFVYRTYGETIVTSLFGEQPLTMYVESIPISVSVADEPAEHTLGLSGVTSLGEYEGKLFVFSQEDYYGMWMKDMQIPLDILWIDNASRIVHIEKNVTPDTYPDSFVSPVPARFVLEVNAYFTDNANVVVGDEVKLPASAVPYDLIEILQ